MTVKFRLPDRALTNVAMQMRLRDVGLRFDVKTGEIDESSLANVAGGAEAVKHAAGKDGVLDYFETFALRRAQPFREGHATQVRSIAINAKVAMLELEAGHCAGLLGELVEHMYAGNRVDVTTVKVATQAAKRLGDRLREYQKASGDLGIADPSIVASLEGALAELTKGCARMVHVLSHARTELLANRADLYGVRRELYGACDTALAWLQVAQQFAADSTRQP